MRESLESRMLRWKFNVFPAYRGTGGRVRFIAADFREVRVEVPLSLRTRNVFGTIFGGSMYGAVDPIYAIMLTRNLGRDYIVWDKAATIRFRKPGRTRLSALFTLAADELETIEELTAGGDAIDRTYNVDLVDADGIVHASIEKIIYVRRRRAGE